MDKADIEAVKAANPIFDVLRDLGLPVQNGRIRCPRPENHANGDRTPSVSVWPDRGQFKCWVCADVKGDVIDLVRLARGCTFREALEYLARNNLGDAVLPPLRHPKAPGRGRIPLPPDPGPDPRFRDRSPLHAPQDAPASREAGPAPSLFPDSDPSREAPPAEGRPPTAPAPYPEKTGSPPHGDARETASGSAKIAAPAPPAPHRPYRGGRTPEEDLEEELLRQRILQALIEACPPVSGKVAQYLQKRRIFKRTWDRQGIRMIDDYAGVSRKLEAAFGRADLERAGFFNAAGHLRYYRHKLLFPYFDPQGRPVYMQARAIDADAVPKELSMSGPIPLPYNCRLLDGEPGQIYLCEGVIDTLTLLEQGFPSIGVPGAANFKPGWAPLFRNKSVHVAFDPDGPGESGAAKTIERLQAYGIEARRLTPPTGMDLNDWFRKG
ncbi:MAG: zinc finger CHC2-family protein [Fibrobacteres bacterium]|nr:zinc finger CHC2-family protein [Fibrobacterota bacterium]